MATAETAPGRARVLRGVDRAVVSLWRLLSSLAFALVLLAFIAAASLISIALPQIPEQIEENPAAVASWVELQEGKFGAFADPMYRLGLFDVFSSRWFIATLGLLAVSTLAYVASRLPQLVQNVASPQERVPDAFFERAANRAALSPPSPGLAAVLATRRYAVRSHQEGAARYLFADRFAWAQVGNVITHLALIIFLAGALTSSLRGYSNALLIAEGTTSPVFAVSDPDQMQVEVVDAVGRFDESGSPEDYRTELVIYQGGEEVARGVTTINDPVAYGGYRFHQSAFFGEGAALTVRDATSGNAIYNEVLALPELLAAPAITIADAGGGSLLDDVIVPTDAIQGAGGSLIRVPGDGRQFWVGMRRGADGEAALIVFGRDDASAQGVLAAGDSGTFGDLTFTFREAVGLPYVTAAGVPGDNATATVVLSEEPDGTPFLTVLDAVDGRALTLYPDRSVEVAGREYVFGGRKEFAGIQVRRDPGAAFIWVATGFLLLGLCITFYVPRMRLWVREQEDETVIVGPAERSGAFDAEVERIVGELGRARRSAEERGSTDV